MQSQTSSVRRAHQPPAHEHRDWRHPQRAAVVAHKQLGNVAQTDFRALFIPAASIAVWFLQHAPHLAQRERLHILVAHAAEYQALDPESVSVLLRLPHATAVDSASGHLYQLQDSQALLLDMRPISASILAAFPGNEHLLLRAIWAAAVYRDHVAPFVQHVDAALAQQFSTLDSAMSETRRRSMTTPQPSLVAQD
jgi:hypothetical protein